MYLTDMADVLRAAGLRVVEVDGWKKRGHGPMKRASAIVWHHTATSAKAVGDYPSLRIVRDGRSDLPGPLCNLGLGRDGTWYVVAAGFAYHAGSVRSQYVDVADNDTSIGVEAENDGVSGVWPAAQYASYVKGTAALAKAYKIPASRVLGHKEISTAGKIDPYGIDMTKARAAVQAGLDTGAQVGTGMKPLDVDGSLGPLTITAWQRYSGTTPDGVISDPSNLISAVQATLNRVYKIDPPLTSGRIDWLTEAALMRHYGATTRTGWVKVLQTQLNTWMKGK